MKYFGEIVIFNFVSERNVMPLRLEDVATKISREISWKKGRVEWEYFYFFSRVLNISLLHGIPDRSDLGQLVDYSIGHGRHVTGRRFPCGLGSRPSRYFRDGFPRHPRHQECNGRRIRKSAKWLFNTARRLNYRGGANATRSDYMPRNVQLEMRALGKRIVKPSSRRNFRQVSDGASCRRVRAPSAC